MVLSAIWKKKFTIIITAQVGPLDKNYNVSQFAWQK